MGAKRASWRSKLTIGGTGVNANAALSDNPAGVNADPEGAGWFFRLRISNRGEFDSLMQQTEYDAFVKES